MKIGLKITLSFSSIVLLTAAVGLLTSHISKKALVEAVGENSAVLAKQIMNNIERNIFYTYELFDQYAKDIYLQKFLEQANQDFDVMPDRELFIEEQERLWRSMAKESSSEFMQVLMNNSQAKSFKDRMQYYEEHNEHKLIGEIFVTNKYGVNVAQTNRTSDYRQDDEDWWQKAKAEGAFVGDYEFDESSGIYSIPFAIRVEDENGGFLGVIKIIYNFDDIIQIVNSIKEMSGHPSANYLLINNKGEVILATEVHDYDDDEFSQILMDVRNSQYDSDYYIKEANDHEEEELYAFAVSKGYRYLRNLGWTLVIEYETEEVLTSVEHVQSLILMVTSIAMILSIILGFLINRSVGVPLSELEKIADEIGKGNLEVPINIRGKNEVGRLAKAFKEMMLNLQKVTTSYDRLDIEVQERRKVEEDLRSSEERSRAIVETANDAFITMDDQGIIVQWNKKAEEMFGWAKHESLNKNLFELIIPLKYRQVYIQELKYYMATGESKFLNQTIEAQVLHRDEHVFPVEITIWLTELKGKHQFNAFIRDMTNRKKAEDRFKALLEATPDALVIINDEGKIVLTNKQAGKLFGYDRKDLIEKPLEYLLPEHFRSIHPHHRKEYFQSPTTRQMGTKELELKALHHRGHEFPVDVSLSPLEMTDGFFVISAIRDISQRKQEEKEMRAMNERLAIKGEESLKMFSELQEAHEQLKEAQAQVLQSEKLASIGQLAAGVAHEINNPVGFISSNLQTLEEYAAHYLKILRIVDNLKKALEVEDNAKAKKLLGEMKAFEEEVNLNFMINDMEGLLEESRQGLERVKKIVLDLRTFARDDKGEMEHVSIIEVIESILGIVHNEIKYKAEIIKDYGSDPLPLVRCNAQRIGQVFMNIIVNAAQAIEDKGKIYITITYDQSYVFIAIRDTGKGISKDKVLRIFEPFYTSKPVGQGTGLGLSISYEIVKKYQGDIKVISEEGQGTTFTIILPILNELNISEREA